MLIYLHIPKTAGTTLRMILDREYDADQRLHIEGLYTNEDYANVYGPAYFDKVSVISGHQYFGLHKYINEECTYITMLRDPIERVLSTYRHTVRIGSQDMGWLQLLTTHEQGSNLQTKMLAGGEVNLDLAIDNLNSSFAAVGISEMFDESILLMKRKLSWSMPYYVIENPSHNTIRLSDIDEDIVSIIRDANAVDIQLYDYYVSKLKAEIDSLGDGFQTILTEFRTQNELNKNNVKQEHAGPGAPENIPLTDLPREKILPVVGSSK